MVTRESIHRPSGRRRCRCCAPSQHGIVRVGLCVSLAVTVAVALLVTAWVPRCPIEVPSHNASSFAFSWMIAAPTFPSSNSSMSNDSISSAVIPAARPLQQHHHHAHQEFLQDTQEESAGNGRRCLTVHEAAVGAALVSTGVAILLLSALVAAHCVRQCRFAAAVDAWLERHAPPSTPEEASAGNPDVGAEFQRPSESQHRALQSSHDHRSGPEHFDDDDDDDIGDPHDDLPSQQLVRDDESRPGGGTGGCQDYGAPFGSAVVCMQLPWLRKRAVTVLQISIGTCLLNAVELVFPTMPCTAVCEASKDLFAMFGLYNVLTFVVQRAGGYRVVSTLWEDVLTAAVFRFAIASGGRCVATAPMTRTADGTVESNGVDGEGERALGEPLLHGIDERDQRGESTDAHHPPEETPPTNHLHHRVNDHYALEPNTIAIGGTIVEITGVKGYAVRGLCDVGLFLAKRSSTPLWCRRALLCTIGYSVLHLAAALLLSNVGWSTPHDIPAGTLNVGGASETRMYVYGLESFVSLYFYLHTLSLALQITSFVLLAVVVEACFLVSKGAPLLTNELPASLQSPSHSLPQSRDHDSDLRSLDEFADTGRPVVSVNADVIPQSAAAAPANEDDIDEQFRPPALSMSTTVSSIDKLLLLTTVLPSIITGVARTVGELGLKHGAPEARQMFTMPHAGWFMILPADQSFKALPVTALAAAALGMLMLPQAFAFASIIGSGFEEKVRREHKRRLRALQQWQQCVTSKLDGHNRLEGRNVEKQQVHLQLTGHVALDGYVSWLNLLDDVHAANDPDRPADAEQRLRTASDVDSTMCGNGGGTWETDVDRTSRRTSCGNDSRHRPTRAVNPIGWYTSGRVRVSSVDDAGRDVPRSRTVQLTSPHNSTSVLKQSPRDSHGRDRGSSEHSDQEHGAHSGGRDSHPAAANPTHCSCSSTPGALLTVGAGVAAVPSSPALSQNTAASFGSALGRLSHLSRNASSCGGKSQGARSVCSSVHVTFLLDGGDDDDAFDYYDDDDAGGMTVFSHAATEEYDVVEQEVAVFDQTEEHRSVKTSTTTTSDDEDAEDATGEAESPTDTSATDQDQSPCPPSSHDVTQYEHSPASDDDVCNCPAAAESAKAKEGQHEKELSPEERRAARRARRKEQNRTEALRRRERHEVALPGLFMARMYRRQQREDYLADHPDECVIRHPDDDDDDEQQSSPDTSPKCQQKSGSNNSTPHVRGDENAAMEAGSSVARSSGSAPIRCASSDVSIAEDRPSAHRWGSSMDSLQSRGSNDSSHYHSNAMSPSHLQALAAVGLDPTPLHAAPPKAVPCVAPDVGDRLPRSTTTTKAKCGRENRSHDPAMSVSRRSSSQQESSSSGRRGSGSSSSDRRHDSDSNARGKKDRDRTRKGKSSERRRKASSSDSKSKKEQKTRSRSRRHEGSNTAGRGSGRNSTSRRKQQSNETRWGNDDRRTHGCNDTTAVSIPTSRVTAARRPLDGPSVLRSRKDALLFTLFPHDLWRHFHRGLERQFDILVDAWPTLPGEHE